MYEAARLAAQGCPHGTVVGADQQTSGHGRYGRAWHSEKESGLYVSFVLRPRVEPANIPLITLALGLASATAISFASGLACDLRWPNDVLVNGRKCCGILAQLQGDAVIAGIGINVNQTQFPPELAAIATSLRIESGREQSRDAVLARLIGAIDETVSILESDGREAILRLFAEASSYASGRRVVVESAGEVLRGTTHGLNSSGFLILRKDDGTDTLVLAGGVRPA